MTSMSGSRAITEILRQEGVRYVFGNPGTTELGLMEGLLDCPEIQYILVLQEAVAVGMAHGYAHASGRTGVVNLHVAPGLGNAIGALYNASMGKIPLVVTAGQQDSRMLVREPLLSHDLVSMASPLCKWAVQIHHPEEIGVVLPRAFKTAQDPPRGPVFVSLPGNVLDAEVDFQLERVRGDIYRSARPDPEGVKAAAQRLVKARSPGIVCGDGVAFSHAQDELVRLAELLGAQVWSAPLTGSLNFPTGHPQFRGGLPPEYPAIQRALGRTDAVLAVGARIFDEVFYATGSPLPEGCLLIQLDDSPWEIGKNLPVDIGLLADPKRGLEALHDAALESMSEQALLAASERRAAMAEQSRRERERQRERAREKWDSVPISPARLMAELDELLPDDTVVFNESITASADLARTVRFERPGSLLGGHGGGIGQALPGAMGAKLAHPDRPVVALVGDGSAMYTIQSLWTAAHHRIAVVYVILSNRTYRILKYNWNRYRRSMRLGPGRGYPHMDLDDPPLDFVKLARGMGVEGKRVAEPDEIQPALRGALDRAAPYVLEILTEGRVSPG